MFTFRNKSHSSSSDREKPPNRFRPQYPRGTCWTFHARKTCSGCKFEHIYFKCGSRHPASQCPSHKGKSKTAPLASEQADRLIHKIITPVKVHILKFFLANYPPHLFSFLINGFRWKARSLFFFKKLQKELEAGRIAGPFTSPPFKHLRCSPLGTAKTDIKSAFRITPIHPTDFEILGMKWDN